MMYLISSGQNLPGSTLRSLLLRLYLTMMKRTGFKQKLTTPLKRSGFKRQAPSVRAKKASKPKKKPQGISILKKKLWSECKRIIRARHGNVCYTCAAHNLEGSNWHTGHFISSSICSAHMRYNLDNLRPQCYRCNINLSGNWVAFEAHLILDHGKDFPDQLKKLNEETKNKQYDRLWYQTKIDEYKGL